MTQWTPCFERHGLHALPRPGMSLSLAHHLWVCTVCKCTHVGMTGCISSAWWLPCGFFPFCLLACLLLVVTKFRWACWKGILFASGLLNPSLITQGRSAMRRKKIMKYLQLQCYVLWDRRHHDTFLLPFSPF